MTVAPEIPGGLELIAWLAGHGVKVSMGHSASTVDEARAGYAAGGRTTTHLFNGMEPLHHRRPGPVAASLDALAQGATHVELIADGVHLADETVHLEGRNSDLAPGSSSAQGAGTRARTRAGLPLPATILSGAATTMAPVGGRRSSWHRLARPNLPAPCMMA